MKILMESWRKFLNEQEDSENRQDLKKIYVLVGPPSVGKSTWIKNTFKEAKPYVINRDDIVVKVARTLGWTYDDMFMSPPKEEELGKKHEKYGEVIESPSWMTWQDTVYDRVLNANNEVQKNFTERVSNAAPSGQDIVVDMTNMNARSRKNALRAIEGVEDQYKKVAVVFDFKGAEDIIKKLAAKRAKAIKASGGSKTIPDNVFDRMFKSFQEVSPEEGFDEIVSVNNIDALRGEAEK